MSINWYYILLISLLILLIFSYIKKRNRIKFTGCSDQIILKDKVVLIVVSRLREYINLIIEYFKSQRCIVVIVSNSHETYSLGNVTYLKYDLTDINNTYSLSKYLEKCLFKIDYLIYDSLDMFPLSNKQIINNKITIDENNNDNNNDILHKSIPSKFNEILNQNSISFFLLICNLIANLDKGEGRIINIIGDSFERSKLKSTNIMNENEKTENDNFDNNDNSDSMSFINKSIIKHHELISNDKISSEFIINNKKQSKITSTSTSKKLNSNIEILYSDSCLINILLTKFISQFSEIHYENILINTINPGIYYYHLFEYFKSSYFTIFIGYTLLPLIYLLTRSAYWITQPILQLAVGMGCLELTNAGYYNKKVKLSSTCVSAKDKSLQKEIILLFCEYLGSSMNERILSEIKKFLKTY